MKKLTSTFLIILISFNIIQVSFIALAQSDNIDVASMMSTIETLSTHPRGYENQTIELARKFIVDKFTSYGLEVTTQEFETDFKDWNGNKFVAKNIIGTLKPNTATKTDDILVIGAHYDGINNIPAANDNASGIGVMLELARLLHTVPTDTEIRFIAFDVEETGLNGSSAYVKYLGDEVNNIIGMLNFDMLAAKKEKDVKIYSADGSENYLSDILKKGPQFLAINILENKDGASDHISFYPRAIPNLFFSHTPVLGEYHTENDIIEHISQDMLSYATTAGKIIAMEIMNETTSSYISVAKSTLDNTVYKISNNIRIPYGTRKDVETALGIRLSQIPSESESVCYQAKVSMFDISSPLTLTVTGNGFQGLLSNFSINMQDVGISFEQLSQKLTSMFDNPSIQKFEHDNSIKYEWYNIFGNTYCVLVDSVGNYYFNIEPYKGFQPEGYTVKNGELIRMETPNSHNSVLITKQNNEIVREDKINAPSKNLEVSDSAEKLGTN